MPAGYAVPAAGAASGSQLVMVGAPSRPGQRVVRPDRLVHDRVVRLGVYVSAAQPVVRPDKSASTPMVGAAVIRPQLKLKDWPSRLHVRHLHGMQPDPNLPDHVANLLECQEAVVRRDRLIDAGMSAVEIEHQLTWRRWQLPAKTVIVTHNGPLTPTQKQRAAVLGAGRRAALCGRSAASRFGLAGWDDGLIHVLVERGTTPPRLPLPVAVHESRR
jgi:hypothetical protein